MQARGAAEHLPSMSKTTPRTFLRSAAAGVAAAMLAVCTALCRLQPAAVAASCVLATDRLDDSLRQKRMPERIGVFSMGLDYSINSPVCGGHSCCSSIACLCCSRCCGVTTPEGMLQLLDVLSESWPSW